MSRKILYKAVLYALVAVLPYGGAAAQSSGQSSKQTSAGQTSGTQEPQLPSDPNQFIRQVVQHELAAGEADHSHWMYHLHREDDKGAQDRQVIETKDGSIARVLLINGQPLTPEQRNSDEERMKRLVSSPEERARREKRNKEEEEKARQLLKAIPDAFIFKYEGNEGTLTRLSFSPNPNYNPPTRELTVYHAMVGKFWADRVALRLAKIDGRLTEDVNFGWGILGHLDKGGTFTVIQNNVGENHWDTVLLDVQMQGRAVIFKTIAVKEKQVLTNFHRVPDDLSMDKAFEMLHKTEASVSASTEARK
jgi:hypothetical protein